MTSRSKLWNFSASLSYGGLFYSKLMRYYDGYILGMTKGTIEESTVFDVGAGEGNFAFEAVKAGAKKVYAIENNPMMCEKIRRKIKQNPEFNKIETVEKGMYEGVVYELAEKERPGIIHFKRCLYEEGPAVISLLRESYDSLKEGGFIFIIHPERDNRLYVDDGFGRIAFDHVAKLVFNSLKFLSKDHNHKRYSRKELEEICREFCHSDDIQFLPSSRPAYHFVAIQKNDMKRFLEIGLNKI